MSELPLPPSASEPVNQPRAPRRRRWLGEGEQVMLFCCALASAVSLFLFGAVFAHASIDTAITLAVPCAIGVLSGLVVRSGSDLWPSASR